MSAIKGNYFKRKQRESGDMFGLSEIPSGKLFFIKYLYVNSCMLIGSILICSAECSPSF